MTRVLSAPHPLKMDLNRSAVRLFAFVAFSTLLPLSEAQAAPPLLVPFSGTISKSEGARPFKSEGQRVHVNRQDLERAQDGEELELLLPNGKVHVFVSGLVKYEGDAITTWVGRHKGSAEKLRAIIATGPAGSFGSIGYGSFGYDTGAGDVPGLNSSGTGMSPGWGGFGA